MCPTQTGGVIHLSHAHILISSISVSSRKGQAISHFSLTCSDQICCFNNFKIFFLLPAGPVEGLFTAPTSLVLTVATSSLARSINVGTWLPVGSTASGIGTVIYDTCNYLIFLSIMDTYESDLSVPSRQSSSEEDVAREKQASVSSMSFQFKVGFLALEGISLLPGSLPIFVSISLAGASVPVLSPRAEPLGIGFWGTESSPVITVFSVFSLPGDPVPVLSPRAEPLGIGFWITRSSPSVTILFCLSSSEGLTWPALQPPVFPASESGPTVSTPEGVE